MGSPRAFGRSLVLVLVVCVTVFSACVPIRRAVVGPELPVSRPVPGVARGAKDQAVAYGGGVFLVAWVDDGDDLWVTRVDRNGVVIDQSGIRLSTEHSSKPSVAFDGTNFLVVWGGGGPIQGRRVSPGGAVLDPAPIALSPAARGVPEVSFGGGSYLVVWTDLSGGGLFGSGVFGRRLSPDGVVLDPADVAIVTPEGDLFGVDIAFNGTHHLVVWDVLRVEGDISSADIEGTLVTTDGLATGPIQPISTAVGQQIRPVVASTGASFFVAWDDERQLTPELYGARVAADGSVLDGAGIRIGTGGDLFAAAPHDVSWDGVNALVTWQVGGFGEESVRGSRVGPSGTLLDPEGVELASGWHPASAFDGTHHLVTAVLGRGVAPNLVGTRATSDLAPLDPGGFPIAVGANHQSDIEVASDGVNHLVVWIDNRTGRRAVFGARVGPDGQNLDGAGFQISDPGPSTFAGDAAVAFDGTNYFVIWSQTGGARAARISRTGEILARFDFAGDLGGGSVAYGNGVFLVSWVRFEEVMVARVGIDGTVLDPGGIPLAFHLSTIPEIDIAAGASEFLVVWNDGVFPDTNVFGAFVRLDGTVAALDSRFAAGPFDENHPGVAWHDGTYLVVWRYVGDDDGDGSLEASDIRGARVDPTGRIVGPSPLLISTAPGDQQQPDVAFNGRFLVTWVDRRRSTGPGDLEADVYGVGVDPDGTVRSEFVIGETDFFADDPVVTARPGSGDFAVTYSRFLPEAPYGTTRAFLRRVAPK